MSILHFRIIYFYSAVHMLRSDIDPLLFQKIQQDPLSHCSEISGDDPVIIRRRPSKIL